MKEMLKEVRERRDGFTMAELLIVVAIVAVLVAIAIPMFNTQLEKSREATDQANIRSAYAEVMAAALIEDKTSGIWNSTSSTYTKTVDLVQQEDGWQSTPGEIGGIDVSGMTPKKGKSATVTYTPASGSTSASTTITFAS